MSSAPVIRTPADNRGVTLGGQPMVFLVTGEDTKHTSMFDWTIPAGFATGLHVHRVQEETFYVLEGEMRLFLQNPKEEVRLKPGETYTAVAKRPHLVTNAGKGSLTFLIMQGIGEYDYVPMV